MKSKGLKNQLYIFFFFAASNLTISTGHCATVTVFGSVTAQYPEGPVENARVTFQNDTQSISALTNKDGKYSLEINIGTTGVDEQNPSCFSLYQNFPNPFNPTTIIKFVLKNREFISLDIFNIMGQHVRTLFKGTVDAGMHTVTWDGHDDSGKPAGAGVYFYCLHSGISNLVRKMLLMDGSVPRIVPVMKRNNFASISMDTLYFDVTIKHDNFIPVKKFNESVYIGNPSINKSFNLYGGYSEGLHPLFIYTDYFKYGPYNIDRHENILYYLAFNENGFNSYKQYNYHAYCQDHNYCSKFGLGIIIEYGNAFALGDSAVISIVESSIPERRNTTFVTYVYQINSHQFVFSDARLLTFGYVDSATVTLEDY
jgi:hypothetical protein